MNTPLGAAFLFDVRRMGRLIALPELIEDEIVKHTRRLAAESLARMEVASDTLTVIMGAKGRYSAPSKEEIDCRIAARFAEFGDRIRRIPLTLAHARAAARRVNSELPPNGPKNQQFKDSVTWEVMRELAADLAVDLVTEDKGFFDCRDYNAGLATILRTECGADGLHIRLFPGLRAYLNSLQSEVPALNTAGMTQEIHRNLLATFGEWAHRAGVSVNERISQDLFIFVTEQLDRLAVSFSFRYAARAGAGENVWESKDTLKASGSCFFDYKTGFITQLRLEAVDYHRSTGEIIPEYSLRNVYLGAGQQDYTFMERVKTL